MKNYRTLFSHHVEGDLLEEIRSSANKGMAFGYDRFKDVIEVLTGRRLKPKKVGRPVGWRLICIGPSYSVFRESQGSEFSSAREFA